ncbi:hypothetical protein NUU61_004966 [Penicillium alfredii]|uniref:DNA-directed RNA polymerase I subunit RPA34.5 n=1 Tax=Penicillium alfredii TaxID=1506179 RepID=A0A9W9K7F8_9EURO|nr:uncharacterized protein NUU61_004966 [Penicillium alfredii]KAJ5095610.1 hypothetical protein NUU61_004966 [Penicillium alfredii]
MAPTPPLESDSSSGRSASPEPATKQKQLAKAKSKAQVESDDGTSSGSDSGSDSSSDGESSEETSLKENPPAKKVSIPGPQPYKPPSGFKSAKKQPAPSSGSSSLISNLRGKQVFHITAPSFLPLSKVKEVSMAKIMQGQPILTHEGVSYGIPAETLTEGETQEKALLVYDESTQTYRSAADHIPSYHVQELIGFPGTSENVDAAVAALRDEVKPHRAQPKNLKMRFRPVGSLPDAPETIGSSSESETEEPSFKVPKGDREERKRKYHHTEGDAAQGTALPRKKSKKHSSQENEDAPDEKTHKKSKKSHKDPEEKKRKKSAKA